MAELAGGEVPPPPDYQAVVTQPGAGSEQVFESAMGVKVRTSTAADAEFAGRCLVEGFKDKFVHAVGRRNLDQMRIAAADEHQKHPSLFGQILIAEYMGRPAGAMQLKYHGDRDADYEASPKWFQNVGCGAMCGLVCMDCALSGGDVPAAHTYVSHISVEDGFRGKGVGGALLEAGDKLARARGCQVIYLWVASDNRAKNLYSRQGYVKTESKTMCGCARCCVGKPGFEKMDKRL